MQTLRFALCILIICLPILSLWANQHLWNERYRTWPMLGTILAVIYLFYMGLSVIRFAELEQQLVGFDRDSNGYLTTDEETSDVWAIQRTSGSSHRMQIPIVGIIISAGWVGVSFLAFKLSAKLVFRMRREKHAP